LRKQAVDDTEDERRDGEKWDHQKQAVVRNQPQACKQELAADVCECRQDAPADRSEPAPRQAVGQAQGQQAEQRAGEAHEEARRKEVAEQQAAGKDAQAGDPGRRRPAVTGQDNQGDDVRQARV
jgi:hypothetical protein